MFPDRRGDYSSDRAAKRERSDGRTAGCDRGRFRRGRRRLGRVRDRGAAERGPGDAGRCCSRPAARTRTAGSTSRSALARPSPTRRSTGATRPSPIPAPPTARCSGRAARCWAARPRSTAWSISAARPRISTIGASSATPAGRSTTCCPISSAPSTRRAAPTNFTAPAGRSASPMSRTSTRSARRLSRARWRLGFPRNDDFNGAGQDGVGYHQTTTRNGRRCSTAVGYLRPAMTPRQSARRHQCADRKDRLRRAARDRRHVPPGRADPHRAGGERGHPVRRCGQLAAIADAVRDRPGRASGGDTASRSCTICRASGRACRTITRRRSSSNAHCRSRSTT